MLLSYNISQLIIKLSQKWGNGFDYQLTDKTKTCLKIK
jgi:hypothetical protein